MKTLGCFLLLTCILAAIPAYADSDITLFGAAQHQGKLTLQAATQTAATTSNFNPTTFGVFGIRYSHGKVIGGEDRKSTRLNSSHLVISYAVFCLKKKKKK